MNENRGECFHVRPGCGVEEYVDQITDRQFLDAENVGGELLGTQAGVAASTTFSEGS
jgi:hypothetical protein